MSTLGQSPYPFDLMISFGWIAAFLLLGIVCRVVIPFCRKYMIPACMIGGFLGCLAINFGLLDFAGGYKPELNNLEMIIFHLFNMSFICFGLAGLGSTKGASKKIIRNSIWLTFLSIAHGALLVITGTFVVAGYNMIFGTNLLESAGQFLDLGFRTGPGPAMSTGATWQQAGWSGMVSLGLAFAALGYIASIVVGVPMASYLMKKKGILAKDAAIPRDEQRGIYDDDKRLSAGTMRFMPSNVDTMSFQLALIIFTYIFAFLLNTLLGMFLPPQLRAIFWSMFAFLFCLPCGLIVRLFILKRVLKADHLFDAGCHTRILNILIDFIAVAALIGIQIAVVREWWAVLIIASVVGALISAVYYWFYTRKNEEFGEERFLGLYGTATGTVTSGLVLVRMVDPEFKSTVPYELGLKALPNLAINIPLMPLSIALVYSQVFYKGPWTDPILWFGGMFIVCSLIALLPFWKVNGKEAKF